MVSLRRIYKSVFNPSGMSGAKFSVKAIARAYRFGQQKTCLVFKLMVKDSAEGKSTMRTLVA